MAKIEKPVIETEEECLEGLDERQKLIVNAQTGEQKLVPLDDDDKAFLEKEQRQDKLNMMLCMMVYKEKKT